MADAATEVKTEREALVALIYAEEAIEHVASYMDNLCWETAAKEARVLLGKSQRLRRMIERFMR